MDVLQWNRWSFFLAVVLQVALFSVVVPCERFSKHQLPEVVQGSHATTRWIVAQVHVDSFRVVDISDGVSDQVETELAKLGNMVADKSHGLGHDPVGWEEFVDAQMVAHIDDLLVGLANEGDQLGSALVHLRHWTQGQKDAYFVSEVGFVSGETIKHLGSTL